MHLDQEPHGDLGEGASNDVDRVSLRKNASSPGSVACRSGTCEDDHLTQHGMKQP
jgi:hypothetical protein